MKSVVKAILAALSLGLAFSAPLANAQEGNKAPQRREQGPGGPGGRFSPEERVKRLTEELKLTEEQGTKLKALFTENMKKMAEMRDSGKSREEMRPKMQEARKAELEKVKAILTPEQFKKYEEMAARMRRGPGGPGGQGGPGGEKRE